MVKNLKKLFIGSILMLAILCTGFILFKNQDTNNHAHAAPFNDSVFTYVSLSESGQSLKTENIFTVTEGEEEVSYIITNNSVTMNFKPFDYNYYITTNEFEINNFYPFIQNITLDISDGNNFGEFNYEDVKYNYIIVNSEIYISTNELSETTVNISPNINSVKSSLISYSDVETTRTISFISSYTCTSSDFVDNTGNLSNACSFEFIINPTDLEIYSNFSTDKNRMHKLNFQKPVVNFFRLTEPIVMFNTFLKDDFGNDYPAEKAIAPDQTYSKLQIKFLNNDYTENNPLYFNIDFNGFIYNYKLFSKDGLLYVNYIDENIDDNPDDELNTSFNNSKYLASEPDNEDKHISAKIESDFNYFSLIINKTGRYSIEFYDATYLQGMTNANFYSTSFFIREEGASIKPFDNIYVIAQTNDEEQSEYIVSQSTINHSAKITIKNLGDFGKDTDLNDIQLSDVIDKIVISKTEFGIDHVETINTTYTIDELETKITNNELVLNYDEDAYYQVNIYPSSSYSNKDPIHFEFTIVKHAKTTFRYNDILHEATIPYKTEIIEYSNKITSNFTFNTMYKLVSTDEIETESEIKLDKTFINKFEIQFGVKRVSIEAYTPYVKDGEKVPDGMFIKVYGVGDITVYITLNGVTETLVLNSENGNNVIQRLDYGTYTVKIVDSMGSETSSVYTVKKDLNNSAIILIVLISVIALFVIIFILKVRGKVATR